MSCQGDFIKNTACAVRNGVSKVASRSATVARQVAQANVNYNKTRQQAGREARAAIKQVVKDISGARNTRDKSINEAAKAFNQAVGDYDRAARAGAKKQKGGKAGAVLLGAAGGFAGWEAAKGIEFKDKRAEAAARGAVALGAAAAFSMAAGHGTKVRKWQRSDEGQEAIGALQERETVFLDRERQVNAAYRKQVKAALRRFGSEMKRTQGEFTGAKKTFWREALRGAA